MHDIIAKKVSEYDPKVEVKNHSEYKTTEKVPFSTVVGKYADFGDKMLMVVGTFSCMVFGAAMPGFCFMFGDMIDKVGGSQTDSLKGNLYIMIGFGSGCMIFSML